MPFQPSCRNLHHIRISSLFIIVFLLRQRSNGVFSELTLVLRRHTTTTTFSVSINKRPTRKKITSYKSPKCAFVSSRNPKVEEISKLIHFPRVITDLGRRSQLYSTNLIGSSTGGGGDDDDLSKWEKMYYEGEKRESQKRGFFADPNDNVDDTYENRNSEVRVVSFDLDNTLWKTKEVISAANDRLAAFLEERGIDVPVRVEAIMGQLFKANMKQYAPLVSSKGGVFDDNDDDNVNIRSGAGVAPVLLTQLRKDATRELLIRHNGYEFKDASKLAEEAFGVWTDARHDAISDHMAPSVLETLDTIRSLRTSDGHPIIVGAITDGNSDPRVLSEIGSFFDFVVNAEMVGVSKPDRRIYATAVLEVAQRPQHFLAAAPMLDPSILGQRKSFPTSVEDDAIDEFIGPWWVHIGDDFIKDIVAAKDLKMRTIWSRELVLDKLKGQASKQSGASTTDGDKTDSSTGGDIGKKRDVSDLIRDLAQMKVVKMSIGAEDFLIDSMHEEFSDSIVDEFRQCANVVVGWHEEALRMTTGLENEVETRPVETQPPVVLAPSISEPPAASTDAVQNLKFCVFCGAKLPSVAKFCSSCGEKQPQ